MANSKSAEKRNRQREARRIRNRWTVGTMRSAVKKAREAIDTGAPEAGNLVRAAVSTIDKAVTKGALKRQTASRYISRLTRRSAAQ